ncbi:MAG: serine/threonine-protein kinase [Nitrospinota bacterium]|nr:serine/threonine-protein kinase [Nitrospinota bacterium]
MDYLGRYKILSEIGSGAMGVVYKALDEELERHVAIKTIKLADDSDQNMNEEDLDTLKKEARIAARLNHPNIITIFDVGVKQEVPYFVMEYVEGFSLQDLIFDKNAFTLLEKVQILSKIARAIHYAHIRSVIHKDLKPANIMIQKNGEPKVMDFGIAKLHTGALAGKERVDQVYGTPQFMSPEQMLGYDLDGKTDIFSLGTMSYYFLTGEMPFNGSDLKEVVKAVLKKDPVRMRYYNKSIPDELDDAVFRALNKDKKSRYGHANDYSDILELVINKMGSYGVDNREEVTRNETVIKQLKSQYLFFSDFDDEEVVEIFKLANKKEFKGGQVIFTEGVIGNEMYIIIEGKVQLLKNKKLNESVEIKALKSGNCFGEMAILDSAPRSATAMAMEDTTVIAVNEAVLRINNPMLCLKLYRNLAALMAENLRQTSDKLFG